MKSIETVIAPLRGMPHFMEAFLGSQVLTSCRFARMAAVSALRLLEGALASVDPRARLREWVRRLGEQARLDTGRCPHCGVTFIQGGYVQCVTCDARYCSLQCRGADHAAVRHVVCYPIDLRGTVADWADVLTLRETLLSSLGVYTHKRLLRGGDGATLPERLGEEARGDGRGRWADDVLARLTAVLGQQEGVEFPPRVVMRSLFRALPATAAYCELLGALRPLIRGDSWHEVAVARVHANKAALLGRRTIRAVLGACYAERMMMPGRGAHSVVAAFWCRSDVETNDALKWVMPSAVRCKLDEARQVLWTVGAQSLMISVCRGLRMWGKVTALFQSGDETPHDILKVGDTRRGFGGLHTIVDHMVRLEYSDNPRAADMVRAVEALQRDPLADHGGHPLIGTLMHSVRTQFMMRHALDDHESLVRTAGRHTALRQQLCSAAAQAVLAASLLTELRPGGDLVAPIHMLNNALERMDMEPRAAFGTMRTALYATGHTMEQTADVLAAGAFRLGIDKRLEGAGVMELRREIYNLERRWPAVRPWTLETPTRRVAYWLLGDWHAMCRYTRDHDHEMLMQVVWDRAAAHIAA